MSTHRLTRRTFLVATAAAAGLAAGRAPEAARSRLRYEKQPDDGCITYFEGDDPVLVYNYADRLPDGVPERYRRACYCHPVHAPDGTVLTDDFPKDHYHHRGIFWSWPRMKARGKTVQTWHLEGIHQTHRKWLKRFVGPETAHLDVVNEWRLDDGTVVGQETVRTTIHPADAAGRAVDFRLEFAAVGGPVELLGAAGKGYGGFCFRFAPREGTVITADEGVQKKDSNDKTLAWADLSARFAGKPTMSGAAVFVHPATPADRKPRGWTIRHYGFLGPNWPHLEPHALEPGAPVALRYRVYLHRGDAAEGKVAEAYERYIRSAEAVS